MSAPRVVAARPGYVVADVPASTPGRSHRVCVCWAVLDGGEPAAQNCECQGFYHRRACKHVEAVKLLARHLGCDGSAPRLEASHVG